MVWMQTPNGCRMVAEADLQMPRANFSMTFVGMQAPFMMRMLDMQLCSVLAAARKVIREPEKIDSSQHRVEASASTVKKEKEEEKRWKMQDARLGRW